MAQPRYATIDALDDAINAEVEHREDLIMYRDGGEVIVRSAQREEDVFRGDEHACLIAFFVSFLGIKHERT